MYVAGGWVYFFLKKLRLFIIFGKRFASMFYGVIGLCAVASDDLKRVVNATSTRDVRPEHNERAL